jgi:hypothetical protein
VGAIDGIDVECGPVARSEVGVLCGAASEPEFSIERAFLGGEGMDVFKKNKDGRASPWAAARRRYSTGKRTVFAVRRTRSQDHIGAIG